MKKIQSYSLELFVTLLLIFYSVIINSQVSQFPQIYYSQQGASGQNIRTTPSLTGNSVIAVMTSKIGAESISNTFLTPYGVQNFIKVCLPSVTGDINYGYMLCNEFYARIDESNNYGTITGSSVNIRPIAGVLTQWVTIGGQNAKFGLNSIVALTGSTSIISGVTWYQVYLPNNCSQSTGWVSGDFLIPNGSPTNYRNVGGRICTAPSDCSNSGNIGGALITFGSFGSTYSSGEGNGNIGGFFEYKLPINYSTTITCTHPNYNTSAPISYPYVASSHNYTRNFTLSNSAQCTPVSISTHPQNQNVVVGNTASFSVTVNGTQPIVYQWRKNGVNIPGANGSSFTTPVLTISDNGNTYSCFVTNCSGINNATSNNALLTVNNACTPVNIATHPQNQTVLVGSTASFTVTTAGTSPFTYQWRKNGVNIPGANGSSFTTPVLTISDNGNTYSCLVTNCSGINNATSNNALLTVNNACTPVNIATHPQNQTVLVGSTASFTVTTAGTSPFTYQWRKNGVNIPGANGSSFTTPVLTISDNGNTYSCLVTNCSGINNATSNNALLTINNACTPVNIATHPQNQTVLVGSTASFTVTTAGTSPFTYQWRKNGIDIPNATNASYTTSPLTLSDNGSNYICFVTNCNGTSNVTSNIGLLTVNNIVPTINSLICTNRIINNKKFENDYTFYENNILSLVSNPPIKICADGSSASYFKVNVSNPNGIGFRILDGTTVVVNGTNSVETSKYGKLSQPLIFNDNFVEVNYTHPDHVTEGLYLKLTLVITFNNQPIQNLEFPLHIYRAPIVFVHGFIGSASTFEEMEKSFVNNLIYPSGIILPNQSSLIHRVDYFNESLQHFYTNRNVVPNGIDHVLLKTRYQNISAGRVIVIAHSMGGILSRIYLQNTYGNNYRYDIAKLITLNTPHRGTQFANWGVKNYKHLVEILQAMNHGFEINIGPNINSLGAIDDMRVNSDATTKHLNIPRNQQNKVPSVTLSSETNGVFSANINFIKIIMGKSLLGIYNFETNDVIVPLSSQQAGITNNLVLPFQGHIGSSANPTMIQYVSNLIKLRPTSTLFTQTGFPQGTLPVPLLEKKPPMTNYLRNPLADSIKIFSPFDSQTFSANQNVEVDIFFQGDISRIALIIYGNTIEPIVFDTVAVNKLIFQIPTNAVGRLNLLLLGGNENEWLKSESINIYISSIHPLDSINVSPDTINLPLGTNTTISLKGYFNGSFNGINLSAVPDISVQYNSNILSSINQTTFLGKQIGSTNVIFTYQGKTTSVYINVVDDPSVLTASFNYSKDNICTNSHVIFGDESKGMATGYQWTFPGGTPSTSTEKNLKVFYSQPGIYSVKLKTFFVNGVDSFQLDNLITVGLLGQAVITPSGLVTLCQGSSITLTASPADSYLWNNGATTRSITVTNAGDYLVTISNNAGCSSVSAKTQIIIQPIPTIQSSNITFSSFSSNNMTLNWNNGNGTNRIVVVKANSPITGVPIDGQYYYANSNFGNGSILGPDEFVVYNGAGSNVTVRNLSRGVHYHFRIFEYSCETPKYLKPPAFDNPNSKIAEDCIAPTSQAQTLSFSFVSTQQFTVNWSNGNGTRRVVKINTINQFTPPASGTDPTANSIYSGSGEQVIYNGNGNSVTVTGLKPNTVYWVRVYEANCEGIYSLYNTSVAVQNPNSQQTVLVPPYIQSFTASTILPGSGGGRYPFYTNNNVYGVNPPVMLTADGSSNTVFTLKTSYITGMGFRIVNKQGQIVTNGQIAADPTRYGILGQPQIISHNTMEMSYTHPQVIDENVLPLRIQLLFYDGLLGLTIPLQVFPASPLPVNFSFLNVTHNKDKQMNEVRWTTESEINNDHFIVRRRIENEEFMSLSKIQGAGNSDISLEYVYHDKDVQKNGIYYYQIEQVDFDGKVSYSDVVSVSIKTVSGLTTRIYPNPTNGVIYCNVEGSFENARMELYDLLGNKMSNSTIGDWNTSENILSLACDHLSGGVYQVVLWVDGEVFKHKVVLIK